MHWYDGVRPDFYEQLLSEIKIPARNNPKRRMWKARTDRRNEVLDCTVYAIYLIRHLRLHVRKPAQWDYDEIRLRQSTLLIEAPAVAPAPTLAEVQTSAPPPTVAALPAPPAANPTSLPPPRPASGLGRSEWMERL
jgi:phage terminase large subunit GpA-like protein